MDAWLLVKSIESNGERNRGLYILKARGIAHSNQVREFVLTDHGIELIDAYIGTEGVLMGSARSSQLAREKAADVDRKLTTAHKERELRRKQELYEAQLVALRGQYEAEREAILRELDEEKTRLAMASAQRSEIARLRRADNSGNNDNSDFRIQENGARKARKGAVR
jgi:circadian clock protein KaiC